MYEIYCHTHVASQKRYVGQSMHGMMSRWKRHMSGAKRNEGCPYLGYAIRKYGAEAFAHEVLETCETLEAANEAEQWWIAHFGTTDRALGYNLDDGGAVHSTHPETRAKIAASVVKRRTVALGGGPPDAFIKDRTWAPLDVVREAICGMSRSQYDSKRLTMGDFPPGGRFPQVYGCTYNEARLGARGGGRPDYLSADEIRPRIHGITKDAYQKQRHTMGTEYPDATLFPEVYGMTFAEVRDGIRGTNREYASAQEAHEAIAGMTYSECVATRTSLRIAIPHPDYFKCVYGKTFSEVRDGVQSTGRFKPGHNTHCGPQTRCEPQPQ